MGLRSQWSVFASWWNVFTPFQVICVCAVSVCGMYRSDEGGGARWSQVQGEVGESAGWPLPKSLSYRQSKFCFFFSPGRIEVPTLGGHYIAKDIHLLILRLCLCIVVMPLISVVVPVCRLESNISFNGSANFMGKSGGNYRVTYLKCIWNYPPITTTNSKWIENRSNQLVAC